MCTSNVTRIELSLTAPPEEGDAGWKSIPLVEDVGQLRSELENVIANAADAAATAAIVRVAINLHFLAPKSNSAAANKLVTATIPSTYGVKLGDEEDFIFQVNRPYESSEVRGTRMNCLTKWSVDRLQVVRMAIPVGGGPALASPVPAKPQTATFTVASVAFDINNPPAEQRLSGGQQSSLLREALATAARMAQQLGLGFGELQNE